MGAHRQHGTISRKAIIWFSIPVFIVVLVVGYGAVMKHKFEHARKVWKDEALVQIAKTSLADKEVLTEIDQMKHPTSELNFGWTHEHVLLMTNGEFLVYAFRHGFNSGFVDHLFLAHGSDGHWYYSTYHFCNRMAAVVADEPPGSIAEFARRYSVREFDGKSDVCLQHTWP
jgi:hypothetical protein